MQLVILAALGGAIGSGARYLVTLGCTRAFGPAFPWGTLAVNVLGCFAMGVIVEVIIERFGGAVALRTFLMTGVLGGFTTFSAFALDFAGLWERREAVWAFSYLAGSVVLSLAGVFAGLALARSWFH
jgi:CrcB protein